MRHCKSGRKLGRYSSARLALFRVQASSLLKEGRIQTTEAKAKELKSFVEKIITTAKGGDLHARRLVLRDIHDNAIVRKLFDEIAPKYVNRNGGYTRVLKVGARRGDAAPIALIELV
ncbi:MAG: 50S ribosomal protein L17 [Deinococcaceae bacterium]